MSSEEKIPVLITTDRDKRGVFSGLVSKKDIENESMDVEEVRMAVYWSRDVKGVVGLAATGPTESCRITEAAKKAHIKGITCVMELTDEAWKAWRKEPWKN